MESVLQSAPIDSDDQQLLNDSNHPRTNVKDGDMTTSDSSASKQLEEVRMLLKQKYTSDNFREIRPLYILESCRVNMFLYRFCVFCF